MHTLGRIVFCLLCLSINWTIASLLVLISLKKDKHPPKKNNNNKPHKFLKLSFKRYNLTEIRCSRNTELGDIIATPDKNFYDFNETIHFQCAGDKTVYGPTSARCSEQGWEYEGSSMPVCASKCETTSLITRNAT